LKLRKPKKIDRLAYVRGLLAMHNIRNRQLARHLGVTDTCVGRVLSGRAKSRRVQQAVAEFLDMTFEEVWGKSA
jgi:lambda repressor-like predicted transcriptional regulator